MSGFRKCLYISENFSGTDIYCSHIKNASVILRYCKLNFFCLLKIIFQNSQNFFTQNACEIKIFSSICRKNGKTQPKLVKTT